MRYLSFATLATATLAFALPSEGKQPPKEPETLEELVKRYDNQQKRVYGAILSIQAKVGKDENADAAIMRTAKLKRTKRDMAGPVEFGVVVVREYLALSEHRLGPICGLRRANRWRMRLPNLQALSSTRCILD